MRFCLGLIIPFTTILLSVGFLDAASNAARKDPSAIAIVEAAITAMGGDAAVLQIKDSVVTGTIAPAAKGSWVQPASFTWKTLGPEFRYETQRDKGTQIYVSGHGQPAVSNNGKVKRLFAHVLDSSAPFHLPFLVLMPTVTDPAYSLIDSGSKTLSGKAAFTAQISYTTSDTAKADVVSSVTQQTWYVDQASGSLLRVEYRIPEATNMDYWTDAAMEFSDFRNVNGLVVPFSMTYYEAGVALATVSINAVTFNVGLDPSEFDLPGGAK